ncbi:hypothetical protein FNH08_21715 [Streptomyces spongiae]|uniref:Uncharacterized protein n=1 Tax=Streptomyces spongiae TaxID=565072 RepID=A0A5N8XKA4_9ACTN|nr:hypothetical protein [Streptomyces spongiae]
MREPTTETQVTRRAVRVHATRTGNETWGVVRSLREIASCGPALGAITSRRGTLSVGRNSSLTGNLLRTSIVFLYRMWGADSAVDAACRAQAA